jgi:hypothetical protein
VGFAQFRSRRMTRTPAFGFWTTTTMRLCLRCSRGLTVGFSAALTGLSLPDVVECSRVALSFTPQLCILEVWDMRIAPSGNWSRAIGVGVVYMKGAWMMV